MLKRVSYRPFLKNRHINHTKRIYADAMHRFLVFTTFNFLPNQIEVKQIVYHYIKSPLAIHAWTLGVIYVSLPVLEKRSANTSTEDLKVIREDSGAPRSLAGQRQSRTQGPLPSWNPLPSRGFHLPASASPVLHKNLGAFFLDPQFCYMLFSSRLKTRSYELPQSHRTDAIIYKTETVFKR